MVEIQACFLERGERQYLKEPKHCLEISCKGEDIPNQKKNNIEENREDSIVTDVQMGIRYWCNSILKEIKVAEMNSLDEKKTKEAFSETLARCAYMKCHWLYSKIRLFLKKIIKRKSI